MVVNSPPSGGGGSTMTAVTRQVSGLKTTSVIRPTGSRVDAFTTCRWSRRLASHGCPLFDGDVEKGCGACGSMDSMAFCLRVHDAVAAVAAVLAHTLFGRVNVL